MADFKQAIEWLKQRKEVRRKGRNILWVNEEGIVYIYDKHVYFLTIGDLKATDWEIYEDETKITVQEAIDQGLISKYCSCELCKNHPDNIHNKEKPFCLSDEINSSSILNTLIVPIEKIKECFKIIKEDIDAEKYGSKDSRAGLISVTIVKGIINSRVGPKLT